MISCPGCGAGLRFEIETQQMRCDYCNATFDPYSFDTEKGDAKQAEDFETFVWTCPACGGQLETADKTDAMGFCPYCGGASLLFDRIRKQWRPASVIPFSVTKEQCKQAYLAAARKHIFVSNKYKDPALLESFRGIYMPYWSYRLRHRGTYTLNAETGEHREGNYMVSERYSITGAIDTEVDGYSHDASVAFDDCISEDLAPFRPEGRKPFAPGFLSGFYTIVGDVPREKLDKTVEAHAERETLKTLTAPDSELGKAMWKRRLHLSSKGSHVPTEILQADRTLYPVWFMSYRQGDKLTYAAVNGQTGKVSADFPASLPKVLTLAAVLTALVFALLMLGSSVKACTAALITGCLFLVGMLFLEHSFSTLRKQSPELSTAPESLAYKSKRGLRMGAAFVAAAAGYFLWKEDFARNMIPYSFCAVLAALFIFFIYKYIQYQLAISRRRPPQMDRKGASSDEN